MKERTFDFEEVMERVQNDKELLLELFDIFIEDYSDKRSNLDELIEQHDLEMIRDVAHSLKGAAGNISAKAMHVTCAGIESLAASGDLEAAKKVIPQLDTQFEEFKDEIEEVKKKL